MNTSLSRPLAAFFAVLLVLSAAAQTAPLSYTWVDANGGTNVTNGSTNVTAASEPGVPPSAEINVPTNASAAPDLLPTATTAPVPISTGFSPPSAPGTNADALVLNFRNAPLDMVLNYLSDAAGFIIVLDTAVHGSVSVISSHPMTRDEAVDLLNSVLNKNGYAAIRDGRTLTILDKDSAKTRDIPVKVSNDPDSIPKNDEIVTQIIPIRFVEARQLVSDLGSFVSPQATIVANEEGNAVVVTDTQENIRHLVEIIKAVDSSAEAETEIRVFHLKYANPTDVATLSGGIFPSSGSGNGSQSPIRFGGAGGPGGFGGGGGFFARMIAANAGGGQGSGSGSGQNQRIQKAQQVIAVADLRTSSVVVTAEKELMEQIDGMIHDLDIKSTRDQKVYVFHMDNGDPQQAVQVLQNMFQSSSSTSSRSGSSSSSQNSALMNREQNNATTSGSSSTSGTSGIGGAGARPGGGAGQLF